MADNRSLDEFAGDAEPGEGVAETGEGAAAEPSDEPDPSTDGSEPTDGEPEADAAVVPMAETFAWSGTGGECAGCGATVEERWRDGADLVCGDCKAW